MKRDYNKEEEFYSKKFKFSYSSLSKLLYSPSLFYKDYILLDKEEKLGKHLIEGKLIHCLLFEPEKLKEKFNVIPGKVPADSNIGVLNILKSLTKEKDIRIQDTKLQSAILNALCTVNLYQSLKEDKARLEKIQTDDNQAYWEFINNPLVDVIDNEMLNKCITQVEILKEHSQVKELFENIQTDFELDPIRSYSEKALDASLPNKPFGIKGIIDYYKVDGDAKKVIICDLKTTSNTVSQFSETVEYYNYWLQAALYCSLVFANLSEEEQNYSIIFKFVVIDKFDQVYVFDVSDDTMIQWGMKLLTILDQVEYHYINRNYDLPYDYLTKVITL